MSGIIARKVARVVPAVVLLASSACADRQPVDAAVEAEVVPRTALVAFDCVASTAGTLSCSNPVAESGPVSPALIGGQNQYVRLTSSNVAYDAGTEIFSFDVTVTNLLNEAIGTPDGSVPDPDGIRVFFASGPNVTGGVGTISVANPDGVATFTGTNQPYFSYFEILGKDQTSSAKNWQLQVQSTVSTFDFTLYVETDVQYLLVINEVMANAVGAVSEENPKEWFELYNAGTRSVNLENLVIADSAASGRRPYHRIASSLEVPPGGYVTLGGNSDTTINGGVPIDYAYGSALSFANSLDALKISRVVGFDTLTIDRTQYSNASTSAIEAISRELKNPALDNANMDGSNWSAASVTSVYGPGGRGTPKAQNSAYVP